MTQPQILPTPTEPTPLLTEPAPTGPTQGPAPRVLVVEHTYAEGTCLEGTRRSADL